jgi:PAS domain S-box-containing protein
MRQLGQVGVGMLLLAFATTCASAAAPKRVLLLNPYGSDVAPFRAVVSAFRTTLTHELGEPVDLYEVPLDLARITEKEGEEPLTSFLEGRIKNQPVDLVVTVGASGVQFAARHRKRLFPNTPVLVMAAEPRTVPPDFLQTNATLVTQRANLGGMIEDILQLQPETTNIVVVSGDTALERFWMSQFRQESQRFTQRVGFTYLDKFSLPEILKRCGDLPPRSFILHSFFLVDTTGMLSEKNEALLRLHEVANAPLFAYFESEFGLGPIGGHLFQDSEIGARSARTAIRILHGERAENIPPQVIQAAAPVYDWRELDRWGISEANLPAGSVIKFREPSFWERYTWPIVGIVLFSAIQSGLIIGLLVHRARRREGENKIRQLSLAAEQSPAMIIITNLRGKIIYVNRKFSEVTGYTFVESMGKNPRILKSGENPPERYKNLWTTIARGNTWRGEFHNRKKNGELYWEWAVISPLSDPTGKITHYVGVKEDITTRKQAETEIQQLRMQLWHTDRVAHAGAITASLAHELNQPLTGILSTAQAGLRFMASDNADAALIREILSNIVNDTKRAGGVINGLRSMLHRKETRREPIHLAATIREVLDLVHSELIGRQVHVSQNLEPDLSVVADKGQIQQVVLNLVMNALDAMQDQRDEERHLKLALTRTETGEALVSLCDSGPGVPERGAKKLFEAFWTTKKEGMGIGLAVSRSIIESHGGQLWFANNPDRGATFFFSLPVVSSSDSETLRKESNIDVE